MAINIIYRKDGSCRLAVLESKTRLGGPVVKGIEELPLIVRAGRAFDQKAPLALVPLVVHCGDDVPVGVAVLDERV